ncbi:MAG: endonuclease [Bacilli bacterium]|nr:endonuclease [Bacilli bacterium]
MKKKLVLLLLLPLLISGCGKKNSILDSSSESPLPSEESSEIIESSIDEESSEETPVSEEESLPIESEEESVLEESEEESLPLSEEESVPTEESLPDDSIEESISTEESVPVEESSLEESIIEEESIVTSEEESILPSEEESISEEEPISDEESIPVSEEESFIGSESEVQEFYSYNNYYDEDLTWNDSEELINKLHNIISSNVTSLKYEGNWAVNQNADQSLYDHEMVNLLYSYDDDLKTHTYASGSGWQREHAFAASLMTGFTSGDAVKVGNGRATDFHNLFASSYSGNTSRGNKNFGIANLEAEDGSYQNKGAYSFDSKNFEPSEFDKGRLARAIFYMCVMYNQNEDVTVKTTLNYNDEDKATYGQASTTVSIPVSYKPLTLVEDYVPYSKVTYTNWYYVNDVWGKDEDMQDVLVTDVHALVEEYGSGVEGYARYSMDNCQFAFGNRSTLVDWGESYEIDLLEMQHNNYVYSVQGNRNPFIDYPELIDYVYGDKMNTPGRLSSLRASYLTLGMNEEGVSHYALTEATREFDSGSEITNEDFKIFEVNKDLTLGNEYQSTFSYTFTSADVENGSAIVEIPTPLNTIALKVKVNAGSFNSCSYKYEIIGSAASTAGSEFVNYTNGKEVTLGDTIWTFSWTNPNGAVGSKDKTYGLAFGKNSSSRMNSLTIATKESHTVNAVYIKGATAANESADYKIYVGDELVVDGSFTRVSGGPSLIGGIFATRTGQIRIVIDGSGAHNGAIYIHSLAYNER